MPSDKMRGGGDLVQTPEISTATEGESGFYSLQAYVQNGYVIIFGDTINAY